MSPSPRRPGAWAVVGVSLAALAAGTFATVGIGALAPSSRPSSASRVARSACSPRSSPSAPWSHPAGPGRLPTPRGPARVLAISLVLFAAAILVAALAPAGWLFMAAMLVGGLAYGGINPPTNVVIAGRMQGRLGFFMSVKQTGVPVGGLLAGLVLPPLAIWVSWRFAFGVTALVALAVAGSTVAASRAPRCSVRWARPATATARRRRERISIGFYGFVMAGSQWVFLTYVVLYLTD